jgi:hypothetical protein
MTTWCLLLPVLLPVYQTDKPVPPPLTEEQRTELTKLVRTTQEQAALLKARLESCQHALARCYAEFELDERAVDKLEAEILEVQRQLLDNYHQMQVKLRTIVGKERFATLKQRLDRILGTPSPKQP